MHLTNYCAQREARRSADLRECVAAIRLSIRSVENELRLARLAKGVRLADSGDSAVH